MAVLGGFDHGCVLLEVAGWVELQVPSVEGAVDVCVVVAAASNGYTPFTDSVVHDDLLRLKLASAVDQISDPAIRKQLEVDLQIEVPASVMSVEVLEYLVPEPDLASRSLEELLEYRRRATLTSSDAFTRGSRQSQRSD